MKEVRHASGLESARSLYLVPHISLSHCSQRTNRGESGTGPRV